MNRLKKLSVGEEQNDSKCTYCDVCRKLTEHDRTYIGIPRQFALCSGYWERLITITVEGRGPLPKDELERTLPAFVKSLAAAADWTVCTECMHAVATSVYGIFSDEDPEVACIRKGTPTKRRGYFVCELVAADVRTAWHRAFCTWREYFGKAPAVGVSTVVATLEDPESARAQHLAGQSDRIQPLDDAVLRPMKALKVRIPDFVRPEWFPFASPEDMLAMRDDASEFGRERFRVLLSLRQLEADHGMSGTMLRLVEDIELTAFEMVYAVTQGPDCRNLASAISTDFGGFARALCFDFRDYWLSGLFDSYRRGVFPCGHLQPLDKRLEELLNATA